MFRYIQFVHLCQLQKSRGSRMAESGAVLAEDLFAASLAADSDRRTLLLSSQKNNIMLLSKQKLHKISFNDIPTGLKLTQDLT